MLSKEFPKRAFVSLESIVHLQKQIVFGQTKIFSQSKLWKLQKYFVYFKTFQGHYGEKDWLFRKSDASKADERKKGEKYYEEQ